MQIQIMLTVNIDDAAWASEYGLTPREVPNDVKGYFATDDVKETINSKQALGPVAEVTDVAIIDIRLSS